MTVHRSATYIKKYIQNASNRFPGKELWFHAGDNSFWAFEKDGQAIQITNGIFQNDDIDFHITVRRVNQNEHIDDVIEDLIREKTHEGFECFAISI